MTIGILDLEGHANDFWVDQQCVNAELDPRQVCDVRITFRPTEPGDREAVTVIEHDAPDEAARVSLLGIAAATRNLRRAGARSLRGTEGVEYAPRDELRGILAIDARASRVQRAGKL